ncbi:MAG: hypothetical protein ACYDCD_12585 [Candidatus Acidiferrales bacterium]
MNVRDAPMRLFSSGMALAAILAVAQQLPVTIPHVRSGRAELLQQGRLTILKLSSPKGPVQRIALTRPSDYRQGTDAPFDARLIAESPHRFIIFTDTFASNPGDIQGKCGGSETGERFVHVVALGAIPHETLSVLVDSCLLDLEATPASPEWLAKPDSAGYVGQLIIRFEPGTQPTTVYYVGPDGSVTRPEIKPNPRERPE